MKEKIISIIQDTDKNYSPYYHVIPELIKKHKYKLGIEIGVFAGGHAQKILEAGASLIGIDPYKYYDNGMPLMNNQEHYNLMYDIVMNRLLSVSEFRKLEYRHIRQASDDAFPLIKESVDFIFVDGLHTFEQCTKDLENYSKLVKKGGLIAAHDYIHPTFPELTTAIDNFAAKYNTQLYIAPLHLVYMFKTW